MSRRSGTFKSKIPDSCITFCEAVGSCSPEKVDWVQVSVLVDWLLLYRVQVSVLAVPLSGP